MSPSNPKKVPTQKIRLKINFDLIRKGNSPNKGMATKYVFIINAKPIQDPEISI